MKEDRKKKTEADNSSAKKPEEQASGPEPADEYAGYTRDDPPPWLDEFEYIDFMITHPE